MEILVANMAQSGKRVFWNGGSYYVAPITLIVSGVLPGSKGPLFYSTEQFEESRFAWNGIPILINHPVGSSGRTPEVIEKAGIGTIFNAEVNGSRLVAEGWFNVEKLRSVNPALLAQLESGKKIEVSTGLGISVERVAGTDNKGRKFEGIARQYAPDHLAILTDTKGACSVADGCGVFNDNPDSKETADMANNTKLDVDKRTSMVDYLVKNCSCWAEDDRKALNDMDDKGLTTLHNNAKKIKELEDKIAAENAKQAKKNEEEEEEEEEDMEVNKAKSKNSSKANKNEKDEDKKVDNTERVIKLADLPQEVQNQIAYGNRRMTEDKQKLVLRLVENAKHLDDAGKEAYGQFLTKMGNEPEGMQKLETLAEALPPEETVANEQFSLANYGGRGLVGSVKNQFKPEPLGLPSWDFGRKS